MEICNTIVCLDTKRKIDLKEFYSIYDEHCKYNPSRFPGLCVRLKEFRTTVLLFKSGKLVCTGAKNMETARYSIRFVLEILEFPTSLAEM